MSRQWSHKVLVLLYDLASTKMEYLYKHMESTPRSRTRKVLPFEYIYSTMNCFFSLPAFSRLFVCYILVSCVTGLGVDKSWPTFITNHNSKSFEEKLLYNIIVTKEFPYLVAIIT